MGMKHTHFAVEHQHEQCIIHLVIQIKVKTHLQLQLESNFAHMGEDKHIEMCEGWCQSKD